MRLTKQAQVGGYGILNKRADKIIIKGIDIKQKIITCDLVKGDPEADDCEILATDRYFYFDSDGKRSKNIPFGDLSGNEILQLQRRLS